MRDELTALGRLAGREALPRLLPHLSAADPALRNAAIQAVVAIEQRATAEGESLDPEVQAALRRKDLVDHLLALLEDGDPQNRRTSAITLGWLKEARAERPLVALLADAALQAVHHVGKDGSGAEDDQGEPPVEEQHDREDAADGEQVRRQRDDGIGEGVAQRVGVGGHLGEELAGTGPAEAWLREKAAAEGLGERVVFTGWLGADALEALYALASVVVFPSMWNEPFGLVGLEAMAHAGGVLLLHDRPPEQRKLVYLTTIERARFRRPVVPGDQLHYHVQKIRSRGRAWRFSGEAKVNGQVVAEAEISAMILDQDEANI